MPSGSGVARICQRGAKARGAKRGGGCPPPTVGIFLKFAYQNGIFCTLNAIIRGRLCEVANINPFLPFSISFHPIKGGGGGVVEGMGPYAPLAMPVTVM